MKNITRRVSVVIPTYGRGRYLPSVLSALDRQTRLDFEVLVVDNNIRPEHSGIRSERRSWQLFVIHEPRNGLQRARNAGVSASRGAFIAFLDDDGVPTPTWMEALIAGMERYDATAGGGSVRLKLLEPSPAWLGKEERALLSELRYHDRDIPRLPDDHYIVGANLCIRRKAFEEFGLFDPAFDRTASSLKSSGELEYTRRLQEHGRTVSFIAPACVEHYIDGSRLSERYFCTRAYWQGRSDALLETKWGRPASFGRRNASESVRALIKKALTAMRNGTPQTRFRSRLGLLREWGYCLQRFLLCSRTSHVHGIQ
jgi:glucosyl-dolichyl phosphate glucuronosyltransferase